MVLSIFKGKEKTSPIIPEKPQVLSIWAPAGHNTAKFSLEVGKEMALYTSVVIAELPCLGIPRLGFISDIIERENCTEAALQELEKKGEINLSQLHLKSDRLAILPASVYATPDYPLIDRLSLETLIDFPVKTVNAAREQGYSTILFECQGQITSPMTFFALKNSDYIFLLISDVDELAFTLINLKRLVHVFKFPLERFCIVGELDPLILDELAVLKDDEGKALGHLVVIAPQPNLVIEILWPGGTQQKQGIKASKAFRFFSKNVPALSHQPKKQLTPDRNEQLRPELTKIRL